MAILTVIPLLNQPDHKTLDTIYVSILLFPIEQETHEFVISITSVIY